MKNYMAEVYKVNQCYFGFVKNGNARQVVLTSETGEILTVIEIECPLEATPQSGLPEIVLRWLKGGAQPTNFSIAGYAQPLRGITLSAR
jgi:hypothetical protein